MNNQQDFFCPVHPVKILFLNNPSGVSQIIGIFFIARRGEIYLGRDGFG